MNGSFGEWTERLKVYNDYINALANYRLNVAKAEKEHAEAANLWALARAKAVVIRELERDFAAWHRTNGVIQREMSRIRHRGAQAMQLVRGRPEAAEPAGGLEQPQRVHRGQLERHRSIVPRWRR